MIRSFAEIHERAAKLPRKRVVVAGAAKESVIDTIAAATAEDLVDPLLVGPAARIEEMAAAAGMARGSYETLGEEGDDAAIAARAVAELNARDAAMLMKGSISTGNLMHAALDADAGLRTGSTLSHVAIVEIGSYPKLMLHTDGGINLAPDEQGYRDILTNAVGLARSLGNGRPRAACLALVEKVSEKLPETGAMAELAAWGASGEIGPLLCEGPLSLDIALSAEAAAGKGVDSEVAGETDIFVGSNTSAVNFVVKSLALLGGAKVAGLVLGARVPIVMLSRSDSSETRRRSLALGAIYSESIRDNRN